MFEAVLMTHISFSVIRCKDLFRPNGKVNAYVKVRI